LRSVKVLAEFTLSEILRSLRFLRMTQSEGLRITGDERLRMTGNERFTKAGVYSRHSFGTSFIFALWIILTATMVRAVEWLDGRLRILD